MAEADVETSRDPQVFIVLDHLDRREFLAHFIWRAVSGTIVHHQHLEVVVIGSKQGAEAFTRVFIVVVGEDHSIHILGCGFFSHAYLRWHRSGGNLDFS